jgi:hypothetical protein
MTMRSLWKFWTDARTEAKALRVFERVQRALGREVLDLCVEPYPKIGGFVVTFWVELESQAWNDSVVELIELGQRVGYGWILSGRVLAEPEGWSNESSVSGVKSIQWIHGSPLTTIEDDGL